MDKQFEVPVEMIPEKEEEQIQKMREKYQYTPVIDIDIQKVDELPGICQDMIKDTTGIING